jgi:hypothetical protein
MIERSLVAVALCQRVHLEEISQECAVYFSHAHASDLPRGPAAAFLPAAVNSVAPHGQGRRKHHAPYQASGME